MKKIIAVVLVFVAASAVSLQGTANEPERKPSASATSATSTPPITAIGADGVAKLLADAKGKVVVLNFWATWCPPCVAEMPEFVKFYNDTKREQVAFISLCANEASELRTAVAKFQKEKNLPFPISVLNDQGGVEALNKALKANLSGALPSTLIYDKDGNLKSTWERDTTADELHAAVKPLLQ